MTVGLVGCGHISRTYLENCARLPSVEVVACADLDSARARARADEFGVARACSPAEILADAGIEVVLNLTNPSAHAAVTMAALEANKQVYSEKPLAVEREDGGEIVRVAAERSLLVGCAPDTVLGGGFQAALRLLRDGEVGRPVAASAFAVSHGMEMWHPNPRPFYHWRAGPLFDMGPYSLTALAALLGPVISASAIAAMTFPQRTICSRPLFGATIPVDVPTHVAAILEYGGGAIATVAYSFDVWAHGLPSLELYGSEGSVQLGDPNTFGGPVRLRRYDSRDWTEIASRADHTGNLRGLGLGDLSRAIRGGGRPRAGVEMAYHVLDVMHAILGSATDGRRVTVSSHFEMLEPVPA